RPILKLIAGTDPPNNESRSNRPSKEEEFIDQNGFNKKLLPLQSILGHKLVAPIESTFGPVSLQQEILLRSSWFHSEKFSRVNTQPFVVRSSYVAPFIKSTKGTGVSNNKEKKD